MFPSILHIDDVRPAIAGRSDFIIAEREWGYVVNYLVVMPDTFPPVLDSLDDNYYCPGCSIPISETVNCGSQRCPEVVNLAAIRRECRGLIFDRAGNIMSRRLHKFFNVNERDETQVSQIDFSDPHVVLEKLDGSMVTPIQVDSHIRWATKMGITDVSLNAEVFVALNPNYQEFADYIMDCDETPIFEWCSRDNRIVVDYPQDRLVLIAIRDNTSGEYKPYEKMKSLATEYNLDVVKTYPGNASSMQHLIDTTKESEGIEGYIIRFDNGHMLKIKGDWYVRIHKTKDALIHEKNIVDLFVNDKIDDVKPHMLEADRHLVEKFEHLFWEGIDYQVACYKRYFDLVLASNLDRKGYAQNWMPTIIKQDPHAPTIVFGCFDGKDIRTMILDIIRKSTSTRTKIDGVRYLWGGHRWRYNLTEDI
jgi:RNA ligase